MRAIAVVGAVIAAFGACLSAGDPCCDDDLDCVAGARCFEARCAPRCDDVSRCDDGLVCIEEAGVCARPLRNEEQDACTWEDPAR